MKKLLMYTLIFFPAISCTHPESTSDNKAPVPPDSVSPVNYRSIIASECQFILAHQLKDGALAMSGEKDSKGYKIVPYFSNIAAQALLEWPTEENIAAVKKWITWYISHLNPDGSVYDYYANQTGDSILLSATFDFDSIDSYAATFLSLVRKLCEVSPTERTWLLHDYSASLVQIGKALLLVMQKDGLTVAKPTYPVQYTMDNAEVNLGLKDMIWISKNILAGKDSLSWTQLLIYNTLSIKNDLWDPRHNRYFSFKGGPVPNWNTFYPDATCQLYPIWCQLISPDSARAQFLWNSFNNYYPEWPMGKIYDSGHYPWALVSYAAAVMRDKTRTDTYLHFVQTYTDRGEQPSSNWYNMEAAFVIFAANKSMQDSHH